MWTCKICDQQVEDDTWETCWHCSRSRDLSEEEVAELEEKYDTATGHSGKLIVAKLKEG